MRNLFLHLIFLLCLIPGAAGETGGIFRYGQVSSGPADLLFRASEGSDGAELFLGSDTGREWELKRLIFESSRFLAGNMKPRGLFARMAMESLPPGGESPGETGWAPDRGETNLNNPGGAFFFPRRGGIFLEGTDSSSLRSGLWYSLPLGRYMNLEGAGHSCRLDPAKAPEEWFPREEPGPAGTLWHTAGDLNFQGPWYAGSLKGFFSGGEHYLPGSALLCELTLYGERSVLTGLYWEPSDVYRNREGQLIPWERQFHFRLTRGFPDFQLDAGALVGKSSLSSLQEVVLSQDYRCSLEGSLRRWTWRLRGQGLIDPEEEVLLSWIPRAKLGYRLKHWDFTASAGGTWEEFFPDPAEVSGEVAVRRKGSPGFAQSLSAGYRAERDAGDISIRGEARGGVKNWTLKGRFLYPFLLYGEEERAFEIGWDLEWAF